MASADSGFVWEESTGQQGPGAKQRGAGTSSVVTVSTEAQGGTEGPAGGGSAV